MDGRTFIVFLLFLLAACNNPLNSTLSETHPYLEKLACERAPGSSLVGHLFSLESGQRRLIGKFGGLRHVGGCELARRHARNGIVCLEKNYKFAATKLEDMSLVKNFDRDFDACLQFTLNATLEETRPGFMAFIDKAELAETLQHLPKVDDQSINNALRSDDTIWYDENSMIFSYQDSFGRPGGPEGLRANRVGYDVGSNNTVPDIKLLTTYFEPTRFRFPLAVLAGGEGHENAYAINYWLPPKVKGKALPVVYWKNGSHWHWTFPEGTIIGEVLTIIDPETKDYYIFEVRSRTRRLDRWETNVFRPFRQASAFATSIKQDRPNWQKSDLKNLVIHLENNASLVPGQLSSEPYKAIFPTINGYEDHLPATTDYELLRGYLSKNTFASVMGVPWKQQSEKISYSATTAAAFHIVPTNYIGGLLETSERACSTCHNQTGRPLGQLDSRVVLYGEIWGEDEIFTWHPFQVTEKMFSVSDGSRAPNVKMQAAGLIANQNPNEPFGNSAYYQPLVKPYPANYKNVESSGTPKEMY